jgi:hypothetical protein
MSDNVLSYGEVCPPDSHIEQLVCHRDTIVDSTRCYHKLGKFPQALRRGCIAVLFVSSLFPEKF